MVSVSESYLTVGIQSITAFPPVWSRELRDIWFKSDNPMAYDRDIGIGAINDALILQKVRWKAVKTA